MSDHLRTIHRFVMEQAEAAPLKERIKIYDALSHIAMDENTAKSLLELANDLKQAEALSRQLRLKLDFPN